MITNKKKFFLKYPIESLKNWYSLFFSPHNPLKTLIQIKNYLHMYRNYKRLNSDENMSILNSMPALFDRISKTPFDYHYVYQSYWSFQLIKSTNPNYHVDLGSQIQYIALSSLIVPVCFVDIRPLKGAFPNIKQISADILHLPFSNDSINSLSCLHVIEHIGLGRYGDDINPQGTFESCLELVRVLKPGGNLFLSLPIGKPRICFNSHRIHKPSLILDYLKGLTLLEFSAVDDHGNFLRNIEINLMDNAEYACGCFHFMKYYA